MLLNQDVALVRPGASGTSQVLWYFRCDCFENISNDFDEASFVHRSVNFESIRRNARNFDPLIVRLPNQCTA
jgi:hypothetical protein